MFWAWILVCLHASFFLVWMWCTIQGVSVLCVVSVMTMIVVSVDIGAHDKDGTKGCHDKLYINKYCSIARLKDLEQPLSPNTICILLQSYKHMLPTWNNESIYWQIHDSNHFLNNQIIKCMDMWKTQVDESFKNGLRVHMLSIGNNITLVKGKWYLYRMFKSRVDTTTIIEKKKNS
jgi:hypothetical protein